MSTRSVTIIHSEWKDNQPICAMYRQSDGYLSGHGAELKEAFENCVIVNGIGSNPDNEQRANGMGCLAAQIVAHFKEGIGGIYMVPVSQREEFNYLLFAKDAPDGKKRIWIKVESDEFEYEGWLSEMPTND